MKLHEDDNTTRQTDVDLHHPDFAILRSGEWMNGFTDTLSGALIRCEDLCY